MKKIAAIGVVAIATVAVLAGFAAAGRFEHRDPKKAYEFITRKVNHMMDEIKATDAQRAQINQLKDKLFNEGMELRKSERGLRQELFANWDAAEINGSDVNALVDKRIDAFRAFAHDAVNASIQLHDILTPEQRVQLKQQMSQHLEHHRGMHDNGDER